MDGSLQKHCWISVWLKVAWVENVKWNVLKKALYTEEAQILKHIDKCTHAQRCNTHRLKHTPTHCTTDGGDIKRKPQHLNRARSIYKLMHSKVLAIFYHTHTQAHNHFSLSFVTKALNWMHQYLFSSSVYLPAKVQGYCGHNNDFYYWLIYLCLLILLS